MTHCQWLIKCRLWCRKWNYLKYRSFKIYSLRLQQSYILVRGDITIIGHQVTKVAFKDIEPFIKYTTKIDWTIIDDAEN